MSETSKRSFDLGQAASAKAAKRLVWFLFLCYAISYFDRINIAFAALSMNKALGLTAATFGLAGTIFYSGYLLCEIPSNILMVRMGARLWIARIMITWGIASAATMFARGPASLYVLRLIVGIAEAGFLPGALLYMTYWFPAQRRGRVTALFMIAQPIAIGFGSLASAIIMQSFDGSLDLAGWQWLFILTGLPAVVLGACVLFYLPDRPATAKWLTQSERDAIALLVASEAPPARHGIAGAGRTLLSLGFVRLCVAYFCLVTSLNALATWSPLIVRGLLAPGASILQVGVLAAIPGIVAAVAMPLWAAVSDRRQERRLHYAIPVAMAIAGWLAVILSQSPPVQLAGLVLCTAGGFTGMVILWTLPPSLIQVAARPLGIAILSCAGIAASVTSPAVIGILHDLTGSFAAGIWYSIALLAVSIASIVGLKTAAAVSPTMAAAT